MLKQTAIDVEPKRVREWKKDLEKIKSTKSNRQRLDGGGRKWVDEELEENLVHWVYDQRSKMLHVSRKMIMWKAKSIFNEKKQRSCHPRFVRCKPWMV